jgi:hypothetical protein
MKKLTSTLLKIYEIARSSKFVRYVLISSLIVVSFSQGLHYGDPEWNCKTRPVDEVWSSDKAFKATILRKACNVDETVFYNVRIDSLGSATTKRWFIPGYELENDDDHPEHAPKLRWTKLHELEAIVRTETLSGKLTVRSADDFVFVRTYLPSKPDR